MRLISACIIALTIASMGGYALLTPENPTRRAYGSSSSVPASTERPKPPATTTTPIPPKPVPTELGHTTKGKYIYDCAEACLDDKACDATVSYNGTCYPKTLNGAPVEKFVKKEGRDLAIEGSCADLHGKYASTKCYPDKFLDCCYDKEFCTKLVH
ncbi:hypothetical protein NliqN6_4565 [Naganishia liquefaciens]|uniref:Uncharacterized protein n=1 Tax=Naganishia liquefaciens TaxID=104408 RepID=A0A8H3YGD2_9TREE|nr:hypothetical protein NliqN6_4565 [Naganishia liquefaciens]